MSTWQPIHFISPHSRCLSIQSSVQTNNACSFFFYLHFTCIHSPKFTAFQLHTLSHFHPRSHVHSISLCSVSQYESSHITCTPLHLPSTLLLIPLHPLSILRAFQPAHFSTLTLHNPPPLFSYTQKCRTSSPTPRTKSWLSPGSASRTDLLVSDSLSYVQHTCCILASTVRKFDLRLDLSLLHFNKSYHPQQPNLFTVASFTARPIP